MVPAIQPRIRLDEHGVAWIEGTATKVIEIALTKHVSGLTPEELQAELPHLSLAQIEAALAYYCDHQRELDAEIERRRQWAEKMRMQEQNPLSRAELLARLKSGS
jgi:uncharacterized protein (DUF433 family)